MYKFKYKKRTLLYLVFLTIGILLFASVGATFAYFQIEKAFSGNFEIGTIGANWYNGTNMLTNGQTYELALKRSLTRGDANGTNLTNPLGTADGDLNIKSTADSSDQYLRFKASATIGKNMFNILNFSGLTSSTATTNDKGTTLLSTDADNAVTITQATSNQSESFYGDTSNGYFVIRFTNSSLVDGKIYTFSFALNETSNPMNTDKFYCVFGGSSAQSLLANKNSNLNDRFTATFTYSSSMDNYIQINVRGVSGTFKNFQLEEGESASKFETYIAGVNLFNPSQWTTATTAVGVTVQYLEDEDCFVLNGTSTASGQVGFKYINIEANTNTYYSISATYVSGSITRSSANQGYAVAYLGKSDEENGYSNWMSTNLQEYNTSQSKTIDTKYISAFWFYFSPDVTLTNYKVKIQLENSQYATDYEPYGDTDGKIDVTPYLTFRYISGSNTFVVGSDNFWKKGSDGYYYYINSFTNNCLQAGGMAPVLNNIVLSGEFSSSWLGRNMKITFKYESLQTANNPVKDIWGEVASSILGLG